MCRPAVHQPVCDAHRHVNPEVAGLSPALVIFSLFIQNLFFESALHRLNMQIFTLYGKNVCSIN